MRIERFNVKDILQFQLSSNFQFSTLVFICFIYVHHRNIYQHFQNYVTQPHGTKIQKFQKFNLVYSVYSLVLL